MAIGATIALPELLKRGYDKRMVTGVIQAGSSLGILVPPSVVLVLYAMIARQPVGQLWLAGIVPRPDDGRAVHDLHLRAMPSPAPAGAGAAGPEERDIPMSVKSCALLRAGLLPLFIFANDDGAVRQWLDLAWWKVRRSGAIDSISGRCRSEGTHDA